jgi:hypothetical protein
MPFLFSYGTLQQEDVQLSTFGRTLTGRSDQLENFEQSMVLIEDQEVKAKSGKTHHPIVKFTGRSSDRVDGTAFEITEVGWAPRMHTRSTRTSGSPSFSPPVLAHGFMWTRDIRAGRSGKADIRLRRRATCRPMLTPPR